MRIPDRLRHQCWKDGDAIYHLNLRKEGEADDVAAQARLQALVDAPPGERIPHDYLADLRVFVPSIVWAWLAKRSRANAARAA